MDLTQRRTSQILRIAMSRLNPNSSNPARFRVLEEERELERVLRGV